jgi:glucose/arabinose dehydrogenase
VRGLKRSLLAATLALGVGAATATVVVFGSGSAMAQIAGGYDFTRPQVVATGLQIPWGMTFLPDGSALVAERNTARILQLRVGQAPVVVATIPGVVPAGESGLLGIVASRTYAQDQWLYVYYTAQNDNRVVRLRLNAPATQQVIISGITKANIHDGGRIAWGPDGNLFVATGDASSGASSQNTNSLNGKILRITATGGVPAGNPFNNPVWSYGHRNVQGIGWDSAGRMWATEFGQNTWDEINQIVAGGNYGWPTVEGMGTNPNFRNPNVVWTTAEASPSGLAYANNTLFAAALRGQRLWTVPVNANGTTGTPLAELQGQFGRLRTVEVGPDGWLWVATSNRDGRGSPVAADDRVIRFPPATTTTTVPPTTTTTRPPTTTTRPPTTTTSRPPTTTTSRPPTTTTSRPPTTGTPGGCSATYTQINQWNTGFQGEVRVTNTGTSATNSWTVVMTFANGQRVTQIWGGRTTVPASSPVTVLNETYNNVIGAGQSTTFGFLGSWSGTNSPPTVTCSRTP